MKGSEKTASYQMRIRGYCGPMVHAQLTSFGISAWVGVAAKMADGVADSLGFLSFGGHSCRRTEVALPGEGVPRRGQTS